MFPRNVGTYLPDHKVFSQSVLYSVLFPNLCRDTEYPDVFVSFFGTLK
jgi:hypothetical protein